MFGAGVCTAALAAPKCDPNAAQKQDSPATATKPQAAQGMMVARDPVTGELRAPTPEEMQELVSQARGGSAAPAAAAGGVGAAGAVISAVPAGAQPLGTTAYGTGVRLTDDFAEFTVVVCRPDGTLEFRHVEGKAAAAKALQVPPTARPVSALPTE